MISVVIATRDRARLLDSTLNALSHQEWPGCPFEILVVDNASRDETPAVVAAAARRGPAPIVYLREEKPGKSHALNTAVAHARGDLLAFTDDDMLPCSAAWLAVYARTLAETGADYATGRILPLWEALPPRWLSPALYGAVGISDGGTRRLHLGRNLNEHIMPLGGNMALRRHVLDRIGGWNPDLGKLQGTLRTGEDHDFGMRMVNAGFSGVYEPEASMYHRVPADRLRLRYFRRWFYENGSIVAGLEQEHLTATRFLLHVPRYLVRQFVTDLLATVWSILTGQTRRATAGAMRLVWFAGYLRGRRQARVVNARMDVQQGTPQRSSQW